MEKVLFRTLRANVYGVVMLLAAVLIAVPAPAATPPAPGIIVEDKPVSLISSKLVMEQGVPCVALADVARALGGTLQVDLQRRILAITLGQSGVLMVNPSRLSTSIRPPAVGQKGVLLRMGGGGVMFEEFEVILLRPSPLMPLKLLANLLGGTARFDPAKNMWVLPRGGPGDPLMFR